MSIIDIKLIDAYTVMVLSNNYILDENDRINPKQLLVPAKYKNEVEVKVAEKIIEKLGGNE